MNSFERHADLSSPPLVRIKAREMKNRRHYQKFSDMNLALFARTKREGLIIAKVRSTARDIHAVTSSDLNRAISAITKHFYEATLHRK